MSRAYRSNHWVIDAPVPRTLIQQLQARITETQRVFDPMVGGEVYDHQDYDVVAGVKLRDGRLVVPRHAFEPTELRAAGYDTREARSSAPTTRVKDRITLRDDGVQRRALEAMKRGGYVVLAPGKGKTVIFLKTVAEMRKPALVFVDNGGLLAQWTLEAKEHLGLSDGEIGDCTRAVQNWRWEGCPLVMTMYQSFSPALKKGLIPVPFFRYFGIVGWDEAHTGYGDVYSESMGLFDAHRIALTATPESRGREGVAYLHIGEVAIREDASDLTPDVKIRLIDCGAPAVDPRSATAYDRVLRHCCGGPRNKANPRYLQEVVNLTRGLQERGRKTMVLCPRNRIAWDIKNSLTDVSIIDQETPFDLRPERLNAEDTVIVTTKIGEKGLNRRDLDAIIIVFPFGKEARSRVMQSAGRVLRAFEGKPTPIVYFVAPQGRYGEELLEANLGNAKALGYNVPHAPASSEKTQYLDDHTPHQRRRFS